MADPTPSALFTDLYELTMGQAYFEEGLEDLAAFELFFRELPRVRNFVMAAGLEDVLSFLEGFRFTAGDLEHLRAQGTFSERFLARLEGVRFTGDVWAVPEGTVVFPNEPIVQIVAPILEAQLVETLVLNQVHFQTVAATKAARVVLSARGRAVVDFGSRRAHGIDAAHKVARTSYLAGAAGTSNVEAGQRYGIPVFGTMAHSYIQAHGDELEAFEAFARVFPRTTLLVDTYDTIAGVEKVIELARRLGERFQVRAIRLDSGDMCRLAKDARSRLDEAGLTGVEIFASSGMDEHKIGALLDGGAPVDAFGVGTKLAVSRDAPDLDMAYKLVEYAGEPRMKLSEKKAIYPGRKQIFRRVAGDEIAGDVIGRHDEELDGERLLVEVMRSGGRLEAGMASLENARERAQRELARLPGPLRSLESAPPYPVLLSEGLEREFAARRARAGGR